MAEELGRQLEKAGNVSVTLVPADLSSSAPISCAAYDLIVVGGPSLGFTGGQLPDDLVAAMSRCTRMEGKTSAAFVNNKLIGTGKSLKAVMGLLEKNGAIVEDFAVFSSPSDAKEFASRLVGLLERRGDRL